MIINNIAALIVSTVLSIVSSAKLTPAVTRIDTADRADTTVNSDTSMVPLTVDALNHMVVFWELFANAPQEIRVKAINTKTKKITARILYGKQMVETNAGSVDMVNMIALAAKYPLVAADLLRAQLTAQQWERYRYAMVCANVSRSIMKFDDHADDMSNIDKSSVLWKNITLIDAHPELMQRLSKIKIS